MASKKQYKRCMRIVVISPGHRSGSTTISILLALMFAYTQSKRTVLTHTSSDATSITTFMREHLTVDATRSLEQVDMLLSNGLLSADELVQYCAQISDNLFFMDTAAPYMSKTHWSKTVCNIIDTLSSFDIIITDIAGEIYEEVTQEIIKKADAVVVVLEQTVDTMGKFQKWKDSESYDVIEDAGDVFVLNQFSSIVGSFKEFTRESGIQQQFCKTVSYTPHMKKLANSGGLASIVTAILNKNPKYATLNNEMLALMQMLCTNLGSLFLDWSKKKEPKMTAKMKAKARDKSRSGRLRPVEETSEGSE